MTHESGYSSSGRSPGNILEDRPSSPDDDDRHSARDEQVVKPDHLISLVRQGLNVEKLSVKTPKYFFTKCESTS